jgi:predicted nucleic acid-binding protein
VAGHARYTAVLDACVLFPPAIADALISLHVAGLYTAKWTDRIDSEWINAAVRDHDKPKDNLERRRDAMRNAVPDWEIPSTAYEALVTGMVLPDPDDEHVIAAALAGHADCIVTSNLKHFPNKVLDTLGLEAIHPDDFIVYQLDLDLFPALTAFKNMRARLRNPTMTAEVFIEAMERNNLVSTATRLLEAVDLI